MFESESMLMAQSRRITAEDLTLFKSAERSLPDFGRMVPQSERLGKVLKSAGPAAGASSANYSYRGAVPRLAGGRNKQLQQEKYPAGFGYSAEKVCSLTLAPPLCFLCVSFSLIRVGTFLE
jgi:hypothetical protein